MRFGMEAMRVSSSRLVLSKKVPPFFKLAMMSNLKM